VYVLTLQRFTTETGVPHQTHFSFVGEESPRLLEFISNRRLVHFPSDERVNVTDRELKRLLLSPDQIRNVLVRSRAARRPKQSAEVRKALESSSVVEAVARFARGLSPLELYAFAFSRHCGQRVDCRMQPRTQLCTSSNGRSITTTINTRTCSC